MPTRDCRFAYSGRGCTIWSEAGNPCRTKMLLGIAMLMLLKSLFVLHVSATFMMTGIIWFVQLAYYPNMRMIGRKKFAAYEREHIRRISGPAWTMLVVELISGLALLAHPLTIGLSIAFFLNAALLLVLWWSTWRVQVPLHKELQRGFREEVHHRLVQSNWLRTLCYSLRALLLLGVWLQSF